MAFSIGSAKLRANGFVFGKFYPLHNGHVALIKYAKSQCSTLTVLVCCSDKERAVSNSVRVNWLKDTVGALSGVEIRLLEYKESELPNTSVSSREVSKAWANRFAQSLPAVDLLVTSEPYGEYVAEYMCIKHISFNADRSTVSISSTDIRNDLLRHWHTIPEAVQKHLQQKVAILGTESTGKTTLANKLAGVFSGQVVEEAARGIIENSTEYSKEDLIKTAIVHAECIKTAVANTTQPLVVIDTDAYITQSYAYFEFGVSIELPGWVYDENNVDLRLYLSADIPYVQDGTRMPKDIRNKLDEQHRKTLGVYSQDFVEINGDYSEREVQAIAKINALYSVFRHVDGAEQ